MVAATSNKSKISLKVIVHKEEKRVIFAEADSNFVDTLFSFMTLPLGTIVRLLEKRPDEKVKALGSLRNVYESLKDLPDTCMTQESKFVMLNPRSSLFDRCRKLELNIDDTEPVKYFACSKCPLFHTEVFSTSNFFRCNECGSLMSRPLAGDFDKLLDFRPYSVFVSKMTTYIVTDDLRVMPNTSAFIIKLLRQYGVTDASHIEERNLDIDLEHILMLLNYSLIFEHPLTYMVFTNTNFVRSLNFDRQEAPALPSTDNKQKTSSKKMTLKLTFQKSTFKFLFAEADSDFVDFVFGFLEIPLGAVIGKLLNGNSSLQAMDNLYASISNKLVGEFFKSQDLKDMLLEPQLVLKYLSKNIIFPVSVLNSSLFKLKCYGMKPLGLKDTRVQESYLNWSGKFMLTDDLIITPLSSASVLGVLSRFKVRIADVEEHEVVIGIEEGLNILKASLKSVSTLTDALVKEIVKNKL